MVYGALSKLLLHVRHDSIMCRGSAPAGAETVGYRPLARPVCALRMTAISGKNACHNRLQSLSCIETYEADDRVQAGSTPHNTVLALTKHPSQITGCEFCKCS